MLDEELLDQLARIFMRSALEELLRGAEYDRTEECQNMNDAKAASAPGGA